MRKSKKEKKVSNGQLSIGKLDEMLWLTTPLGKFQKSNKKQVQKVLPFSIPTSAKTRRYKPRIWVVRIPSVFVQNGSYNGGYQTLVKAVTPGHALEKASESFTWEPLDFKVPYMRVFPKDPAEDI